jgi:2-keto-3-deoxy-L-rhamnonate aldolase RhmA
MLGKEIREALHSGGLVYGTHVTHLNNLSASGILLQAGLDYVFICGEHMPLDSIEIANLCRFYASNGVAPAVRISEPSMIEAARALDLGAHGIIAPYVETVEQVRNMVGAVKYRPLKGQLLNEILDGKPLSPEYQEFFPRFNKNNFLIIGIESRPAYENLDALIDVPGVDGVFLGPHDLTVSFGHPEDWNHPDYMNAMEDIIRRCRAKNLGVGLHMLPTKYTPEQARKMIDMGMNWVLDGSDVGHAAKVLSERRAAMRLPPCKNSAGCAAPSTCAAPAEKIEIKEDDISANVVKILSARHPALKQQFHKNTVAVTLEK